MVIQLPAMCGMQTHPNLMAKVDKAVAAKSFPIDLDCSECSFTTSMFVRFIIQINKKVTKAGGKLRLLAVDDIVYDGLQVSGLLDVIEVTRRATPVKKRKALKHG